MRAANCRTCGSRLPAKSRFCPECGVRTAAGDDVTAVEPVPPDETGPMPVRLQATAPRYFGITPPLAVLALAISSLALGIVLLIAGHVVAAILLFVAAGPFAAVFAATARRLPETAVARVSTRALGGIRDRAGFAVETLSAQSGARVELFRLRRELSELVAQRAETARVLGEAVYGGADQEAEQARTRMRELDEALAAKEAEMRNVAAEANERIQRAQLQVQPTAVVPEPMPVPSEPPQPVTVPEPSPVPSEPPMPQPLPDPTPEPSPPLPEPPTPGAS
jgi:hypothetical protein